jgi:hypothetical protein
MQERHHEIHVGNFLHVCLRHFSSGAVRRFKRQGYLRQSHQKYRHEIGERPQPGPVNNEPIKDAPARPLDQFGFKQGPKQVVAARLSVRITAGQHISNSLRWTAKIQADPNLLDRYPASSVFGLSSANENAPPLEAIGRSNGHHLDAARVDGEAVMEGGLIEIAMDWAEVGETRSATSQGI